MNVLKYRKLLLSIIFAFLVAAIVLLTLPELLIPL